MTVPATTAPLSSSPSTTQTSPSSILPTAPHNAPTRRQPASPPPAATITTSPLIALAAPQNQRVSLIPQAQSQSPTANPQTQSRLPVSTPPLLQSPVASTTTTQTQPRLPSPAQASHLPQNQVVRTQSYQCLITSAQSQPLPPNASTPSLQAQFSSSTLASASLQPRAASTTAPHTLPSVSAVVSPQLPNVRTVSPPTLSSTSSPGPVTPQVSTASIQTQSYPPTSATPSTQTAPASPQTSSASPVSSSASPQSTSTPSASPVSSSASPQSTSTQYSSLNPASAALQLSTACPPPTSASAPHTVVQRLYKKSKAWSTNALALAAIIVAIGYGAIHISDMRWTKRNDVRNGCISDREHKLPLSAECVAELMLPRASAVKRQIEAVHGAVVENALYWAIAMYIPVLTCVMYLVWMRTFARDEPRPVPSLVKMDFSRSRLS
jgi:hypothetical protein